MPTTPSLVRQDAVRDGDDVPSPQEGSPPAGESPPAAEPLRKTWDSVQLFIAECQPLADKLDANDQTKKDRKLELKRLAEHAAGNLDDATELTVLNIINAEAVKSYCAEHAENSKDKYSKSCCAWLGLIATAQGHDDLPAPVCRELSALESLCADTEAQKRANKPVPIDIHTFIGAGTMAFNKLTQDHSTMKYADLALAVWLMLTIFGIPARSRTFRDCRWGEHVKKLATGDWQISLGDPQSPGTKHKFPMTICLSELAPLGAAGLSRPDIVAAALSYLYSRTEEPDGRLIFSRLDGKDSRFGKDAFGRYFSEKVAGLKVEELRTSVETHAAKLLENDAISPRTRSLVSYLQQHKPHTAGLDYVRQEAQDTAAASAGDATVTDADDSTTVDAVDLVSTDTADSGDTHDKVDNESPDTNVSTDTADSGDTDDKVDNESPDTNVMLKTIVQKWEDQQEIVRDPAVDPKVPLNFTRFLDGDDDNFMSGNCITITPYEWFSAPDGHDWCVSWDHYVHADATLTDEEKSFVMDKFELFATHFEPGAAEARRLLDQADHDYLNANISKLTTQNHSLRQRIEALEAAATAGSADAGKADQAKTQPADINWLKEVIDTAEDFKYENCRTPGDIVRFKLAIARAALKRPASMTRNDQVAWAKYNELADWIEPTPAEDISSDESETESDSDDCVADDVLAALRQGFVLKPRARRRGASTTTRKTRRRTHR